LVSTGEIGDKLLLIVGFTSEKQKQQQHCSRYIYVHAEPYERERSDREKSGVLLLF